MYMSLWLAGSTKFKRTHIDRMMNTMVVFVSPTAIYIHVCTHCSHRAAHPPAHATVLCVNCSRVIAHEENLMHRVFLSQQILAFLACLLLICWVGSFIYEEVFGTVSSITLHCKQNNTTAMTQTSSSSVHICIYCTCTMYM